MSRVPYRDECICPVCYRWTLANWNILGDASDWLIVALVMFVIYSVLSLGWSYPINVLRLTFIFFTTFQSLTLACSLNIDAVSSLSAMFSAPVLSEDNLAQLTRSLSLLVQLSPRLLLPTLLELGVPVLATCKSLIPVLVPAAQWDVPSVTILADSSARLLQLVAVIKRMLVAASNYLCAPPCVPHFAIEPVKFSSRLNKIYLWIIWSCINIW